MIKLSKFLITISTVGLLALSTPGKAQAPAVSTASFKDSVQPVLTQICSACHNDALASGRMNIAEYLDPSSITSNREGWERILARLRAGEMPPPSIPVRPTAAQIKAIVDYV